MRIGMMADLYKPHISGVTHYVELNKRYLEQAGHDVFVFTFGNQAYQDDEPRVIRSSGLPIGSTGYSFSFRYSNSARKLLQTMDIVHIQHPFVSGRLALSYCRPLHIPLVFTNHTRYDLYARAYLPMVPGVISDAFLRAYVPWFCQAIDLVISPSAGMAGVLRGMGVTSPIEIMPNGVDLQRFYAGKPLRRSDFGYTDEDILLVYAGRVAAEKNLELLLHAFAGVARAMENVHLLVIGGGPRPIERQLRSLASELKLDDRVRFTGLLPYASLPGYLLMCDAFVTSSISEVHPLSVIEAMACGLPIMGIKSPGVGDTVEDGRTGFLSPNDLPSFTASLMRLCQDGDLRRTMGEAARQASSLYAIERTNKILFSHYERLVHAPRLRRDAWTVRLRRFFENYRQ